MSFITPEELIDFTPIEAIKNTPLYILDYYVEEAEAEVIAYCGHDFTDKDLYPITPNLVKLATLKLSQYYAILNSDEATIKAVRSQSIGDLSFSYDGLQKPDIYHLLSKYRKVDGGGSVAFRLRSV